MSSLSSMYFLLCILLAGLSVTASANLSELHIPVRTLPNHLDPISILDSHSALISSQIYENLYEFTEFNTLRPVLIERHVISDGGKTIVFEMSKTARFSDGTPISADIVSQSLHRAIKKLGASVTWAFGDVVGFEEFNTGKAKTLAGIRVLSPSQLEVKLKRPFASFYQALTSPYFAIALQKPDGALLGTGSYKLTELNANKAQLMSTESAPVGPSVVNFVLVPDRLATRKLVESGKIDIAEIAGDDTEIPSGYRAAEFRYVQTFFLIYNLKHSELKNAEKRCALGPAIQSAMSQVGYQWKPLFQGLPFSGLSNMVSGPIKNVKIQKPLTLLFSSSLSVPIRESMQTAVSKSVKANGVTLKMRNVTTRELLAKLTSGDFDVVLLPFVPDYLSLEAVLAPLLGTGQQYNFTHYSNLAMDTLLNLSRTIADKDSSNQVFRAVFEIIGKDCPVYLMGSQDTKLVVRNTIAPFGLSSLGVHSLKLRNLREAKP